MKLSPLIVLLFPALLLAAERRFYVDDIANPENAEYNEFVLNTTFDDMCREFMNQPSGGIGAAAYFIKDLDDPDKADVNQNAITQNADDIWRFKVGISTPGIRGWNIDDILNPEKSDDNTYALNMMVDEIYSDKVTP